MTRDSLVQAWMKSSCDENLIITCFGSSNPIWTSLFIIQWVQTWGLISSTEGRPEDNFLSKKSVMDLLICESHHKWSTHPAPLDERSGFFKGRGYVVKVADESFFSTIALRRRRIWWSGWGSSIKEKFGSSQSGRIGHGWPEKPAASGECCWRSILPIKATPASFYSPFEWLIERWTRTTGREAHLSEWWTSRGHSVLHFVEFLISLSR